MLLARPFMNTAILSVTSMKYFQLLLHFYGCLYITNHNTLSLHHSHNFTIHPSTRVYESRILSSVLYSMIVLYIRDHAEEEFFCPIISPQKPASLYLHNSLAVLVRHSPVQKCFQTHSKPFQQVSMKC